jgi:hypothetical protein
MAKKVKGKEKQAEGKKTAEIPKEETKNVSASISIPTPAPAPAQGGPREEPEQDHDMTAMGQLSCSYQFS